MSRHEWKHHWKEIKGVFFSQCRKCGLGMVASWFVSYIPSDQVGHFLTTYKPVDFIDYIPCRGESE